MHLDHVELSVARGTLTEKFCADLDRLLTDVLGWPGETRELFHPIDHVDRRERVYRLPERQYLVLHETDDPGPLGGDDHIGLLVDSTTLDRLFEGCRDLAAKDDRVTLRYVIDGKPSSVDVGDWTLRAFFVRYLLPVWLDIQSHD